MARDGLGRGTRHVRGRIAQRGAERIGLREVVEHRAGAVGVDIAELCRGNTRHCDGFSDDAAQACARPVHPNALMTLRR